MSDQEDTSANRFKKSEAAFRTISEVATELDVPQHVLRFWESKFSQVRPLKRGGGRRYYRPEDVALLKRIRDLLYRDGLTIKGVQKLFRDHGTKSVLEMGAGTMPVTAAAAPSDATTGIMNLQEVIGELTDLRDTLKSALSARS